MSRYPVLGALDVLPFEAPVDVIYGRLRTDLEQRGQPMGGNDLLIAAHARAARLTLVNRRPWFCPHPRAVARELAGRMK